MGLYTTQTKYSYNKLRIKFSMSPSFNDDTCTFIALRHTCNSFVQLEIWSTPIVTAPNNTCKGPGL